MTRIFGVGVDIARVVRFERCYARYGDRFLRKAYHADEIAEFMTRSAAQQPLYLASRWAAKEAVYKAFQRYRVLFPEIKVGRATAVEIPHQLRTSLPTSTDLQSLRLDFYGETAALAKQLRLQDAFVSLSHDGDYAVAFVVLQQSDQR